MGYAYTDLIVPAILYLNPGINKEEFANLLKEIHFSSFAEYSRKEPLDYHDLSCEFENNSNPLERIAQNLNSQLRKSLKIFKKIK